MPSENGNGTRVPIKLSLSQVLSFGAFMIAAGGGWATIQLQTSENGKALREIVESNKREQQQQNEALKFIRDRQIENEGVIKRNANDIEEIRQYLGIDGGKRRR